MPPRDLENYELKDVEVQHMRMDPDAERLEKDETFIEGGKLDGGVNMKQSLVFEGQLNPLTVYEEGDTYFVTDGYHRLEGAKCAGRERLKCRVYRNKRTAMLAAAYDSLRRPKTGFDVARLYAYLKEHTCFSLERLAEIFNVSPSQLSKAKKIRGEGRWDSRWEEIRRHKVSPEVAYELRAFELEQVNKLLHDFGNGDTTGKSGRSGGPPLHFIRSLRSAAFLKDAYFNSRLSLPLVRLLLSKFPRERLAERRTLARWVLETEPTEEALQRIIDRVRRGVAVEMAIPELSVSLSESEAVAAFLRALADQQSGAVRHIKIALRPATDDGSDESTLLMVITCEKTAGTTIARSAKREPQTQETEADRSTER